MKNINNIHLDYKNYNQKINAINNGVNCIVISTPFQKNELTTPFKYNSDFDIFIDYINQVILNAVQKIKVGGFMFVYGIPRWLPYFAVFLNNTDMTFKYWIALDIADIEQKNSINCNHIGMLMYVKGKNAAFTLNTKSVRNPYIACSACGKNIKDWGGKKHQINKLGSCVSDVWKYFYKVTDKFEDPQISNLILEKIDIQNSIIKDIQIIPDPVLKKVAQLVDNGEKIIHLICSPLKQNYHTLNIQQINTLKNDSCDLIDDIYLGDCIDIMKQWTTKYPQGCFDLIFADPPYNLNKEYSNYADKAMDKNYIQWCNEWLNLCSKLLKPNGNLLILNLPKWSIYHAEFLNSKLYFKNWIVWDALSMPKGKIMPAHYSLLHYSKNLINKFNNNSFFTMIDAPDYCLRATCIKTRKQIGDDRKVPLSDVWQDISRIKHKRDRDEHPCQLPDKLMERIINLYSNEGDFIFDPFSGAGTTSIIAKKLNRKFAAIDISEEYVEIAKNKLKQISENGDIIKLSTKKNKKKVTKKSIELYIQNICFKLGYVPNEEAFFSILQNESNLEFTYEDVLQLYGDIKSALKVGKIIVNREFKNKI